MPANDRSIITDVKSDDDTIRRRALDCIRQIDEDERARKAERNRLLRYIRRMNSETTEGQIQNLKAMEERILRDIGACEVDGEEDRKQMRISALESVRKEIKRLESSL